MSLIWLSFSIRITVGGINGVSTTQGTFGPRYGLEANRWGVGAASVEGS